MQYLLSEKELQELRENARRNNQVNKENLQWLCTELAKHMPVEVSWMNKDVPEPWGCILDEGSDPGYCDHCPAQELCPSTYKEFSK